MKTMYMIFLLMGNGEVTFMPAGFASADLCARNLTVAIKEPEVSEGYCMKVDPVLTMEKRKI